MSSAAERSNVLTPVNPTLFSAAQLAAENTFAMCGIAVRCVGMSSIPIRDAGNVTGLIDVRGKASGVIAVNMTERAALRAVGGLLKEELHEFNAQVVDGAGEITNLVVGGIKSALADTNWAFGQIALPNVTDGRGYAIAFARDLEFVNVTFELDDRKAVELQDRLVHVTMSLATSLPKCPTTISSAPPPAKRP